MKFLRKLFHTVLIFALAAFIAAYWFSGSKSCAAWFARRIASETGLRAEVASARLGWRCDATLTDLRLCVQSVGGGTNAQLVLYAPSAVWRGCGSAKRLRLTRPEFRLVQSSLGDWTPAAFVKLLRCDTAQLPAALSAIGARFGGEIEITDASLTAVDSASDILMTCAGAAFRYVPLRLQGHPAAAHCVFTAQRLNAETSDFKTEWLVIADRIITLDLPAASASASVAPPFIPAEITEEDEAQTPEM